MPASQSFSGLMTENAKKFNQCRKGPAGCQFSVVWCGLSAWTTCEWCVHPTYIAMDGMDEREVYFKFSLRTICQCVKLENFYAGVLYDPPSLFPPPRVTPVIVKHTCFCNLLPLHM